MIVNFRTREISQGTRKFVCTFKLIKKKKTIAMLNFFFFCSIRNSTA
jgi:hypothetical protein